MDSDVPNTISNVTPYQDQKIEGSWVKLIFIALKKLKLPAESIFGNVGIGSENIVDIKFVSRIEVVNLYKEIELYGQLETLPFCVGEVFQLHFVDFAPHLIKCSRTLKDLLENIATIATNITYLGRSKIEVEAEHTSMSFTSSIVDHKLHRISQEISIFIVCKIIKQVFPHLSNIIANVVLDSASKGSSTHNLLEYPVVFSNDGIFRVIIKSEFLNTKNVFYKYKQSMALEKYQALPQNDLRDYTILEEIIANNLDINDFSIISAAKQMNMSVKTLQRKLLKLNVNFSLMVQNIKLKRATFLLKEGDLSIKQISFELGFTSPSSFSRAFKSWTGFPPSHFVESA